MAFLRNTWYCAGFSEEVGDAPISRKLLNEPVVFFRESSERLVALSDRCPHKFAPLSKGKVIEDGIQCPYHGLEFDTDGRGRHNPFGDGVIPERCHVKAYAVEEREGIIWIWMGDKNTADSNKIISIGEADGRAGWATVNGYLKIKAHHELIVDNLLDLGHVPYLHPFLFAQDTPLPEDFKDERKMRQDGETIWSMNWNYNCPVTPLFAIFWEGTSSVGTLRAHMRWNPPSVLYLDNGMHPASVEEADGISLPSAHLLTPETESSTHYFWLLARNRDIHNETLSKQLAEGLDSAFKNEDEPMIAACAENMDTTDLMALDPIFLPGDAPGTRARLILKRLIADEQQQA